MNQVTKATCRCLYKHSNGYKISWCLRRCIHNKKRFDKNSEPHCMKIKQKMCCVRYMHDNVKEPCVNPINIQMLSANLHEQIFGKIEDRLEDDTLDSEMLKKIQYHLESHGLWDKKTPILPDVDLQLPKLLDEGIDNHFLELGKEKTASYIKMAEMLIDSKIPKCPKEWKMAPGWTKYNSETGEATLVDFPEENVCVFDIETLVQEGHYPTMATAVSNRHWLVYGSYYLQTAEHYRKFILQQMSYYK